MTDLTDDEILDALKQESAAAIGAHDGDIADDTERLNNYYDGKPYGNEIEGRSQFVTREVYETIESLMPYLVKIFFSSEKAVVFSPEDEDDVESAKQETEYVNWVFYRDNPGFKIGYTWIKDGLMSRVGYVKAVRETPQPEFTEYINQTEEQLALLMEEMGEDFEGDVLLAEQDDGLFEVSIQRITGRDKTVISNIPPEEIRISDGALSIQSARYVAHSAERTLSEIRSLGFEIDDDIQDDDIYSLSNVRQDRHDGVSPTLGEPDNESGIASNRLVVLHEEYMQIDMDGDGVSELWQFFRVGDEILSKERVPNVPFYSWSPVIIPHRHRGNSPADPIMDIQLLKSKVTRNLLDNQERINNGRFAVVDGQVNIDDLMSSSPLSIVRENFTGAVRDLPTPALNESAFSVLGLADSWAEKRSGVSERGQSGLRPKTVQQQHSSYHR
jgi:hypothetical protein